MDLQPETFNADSAADIVGATITAEAPVEMYNTPNGTIVKTYKKGAHIGTVDMYVIRDGFVWWRFKDGLWCKHDKNKLEVDQSTTHDDIVKEQAKNNKTIADKIEEATGSVIEGTGNIVKGAGDSLSFIGKNMTVILIILAVIIALAFYFMYVKK